MFELHLGFTQTLLVVVRNFFKITSMLVGLLENTFEEEKIEKESKGD